jgi:2-polyprenyl-3-methyl-5-hydroxy-6-metoxy-1,4-benzoquinol methylase
MSKNRFCPVCNFHKAKGIRKFNFTLFNKHPMINGYLLVQCEQCGFIYGDTDVTQTVLDDYYENLSKYEDKSISTGGGYTIHDKNRLKSAAKYISSKFDNKEIEIVDIGCAIGGLLEQLRNEGFVNLTGIDPSASCVEITQSEKKIKCYHSSLFNLNDSFGKYDLIILSHVWEHILDLKLAIKSIEKILKLNGYIYIECPNAMLYREIIHAPFQEFNTEHINHFTEQAFKNFFGINYYSCIDVGNRVIQIASGEDYNAVYGIFKKNIDEFKFEISFDSTILNSINDYLKQSEEWYEKILLKIFREISNNENIALVGIGQFAFKLLYAINESNYTGKIELFDNNPYNIGKIINSNEILSGTKVLEQIQNSNAKIIITSLIYQDEIKNELITKSKELGLAYPNIIELKQV